MGYELNAAGKAFIVGLTSVTLGLMVTSLFTSIAGFDSRNFSFLSRSCCFLSINCSLRSWALCSRFWAVLRSAIKEDTSLSNCFTVVLTLLISSSNEVRSTNIIVNESRFASNRKLKADLERESVEGQAPHHLRS